MEVGAEDGGWGGGWMMEVGGWSLGVGGWGGGWRLGVDVGGISEKELANSENCTFIRIL